MIATPAAPLTLADMPIGYVRQAIAPGTCGLNLGRAAKSSFSTSDRLTQVKSMAGVTGSARVARRLMTANTAKARSCKLGSGWSSLVPMSFPRVGDQSVALRTSTRIDGVDVSGEMVVFRHRARLGAVLVAGIGSGDPAQLLALARVGLRRLG